VRVLHALQRVLMRARCFLYVVGVGVSRQWYLPFMDVELFVRRRGVRFASQGEKQKVVAAQREFNTADVAPRICRARRRSTLASHTDRHVPVAARPVSRRKQTHSLISATQPVDAPVLVLLMLDVCIMHSLWAFNLSTVV